MDKPKNFKELKKRLQPFVNMDNQIRLNQESTITNVGYMISTHVEMLEANPGNRTFMPYYDRLIVLLTLLEAGWE
jgi:hypothetical protein